MKYYKCINDKEWGTKYKAGIIYPEDYEEYTNDAIEMYLHDFKEVSRLDYIRQRGWYIRGSDQFRAWLDNNEEKIDREPLHANLTDLFYYLSDGGFLKSDRFNNLPKDKIEITVKELDQLYNSSLNENHDFSYPIINLTNENKSMFKPGDKIVILDTSLYRDYDDKVRTIIKNSSLYDWECERSCVNSNNIRHATPEEIEVGHKLNKPNMQKFEVKVTPTTSRVLQQLAFENGYEWNGGMRGISTLNSPYLQFWYDQTITHSLCSDSENTTYLGLEEAIERICQKERFKDGDWVYFHEGRSTKWIFRYKGNEGETYFHYEAFTLNSKNVYGGPGRISGVRRVRRATADEIKMALVAIAKNKGFPCQRWEFSGVAFDNPESEGDWKYTKEEDILHCCGGTVYKKGEWATPVKIIDAFGFKVQKTLNGIFKFGCSDHAYTEDELSRVINTLEEVPKKVSVGDLVNKLNEIARLRV